MTDHGTVWGGLTTITDDVVGGTGDAISNAFTGTAETAGGVVGGLLSETFGGFGRWLLMMAALVAAVIVIFGVA